MIERWGHQLCMGTALSSSTPKVAPAMPPPGKSLAAFANVRIPLFLAAGSCWHSLPCRAAFGVHPSADNSAHKSRHWTALSKTFSQQARQDHRRLYWWKRCTAVLQSGLFRANGACRSCSDYFRSRHCFIWVSRGLFLPDAWCVLLCGICTANSL